MPDAKPFSAKEVDALNPPAWMMTQWRLIATVRDRERERDEYLRIIQTNLNVQIDAAEGALVAAGLEDFETLAAGIAELQRQLSEARKVKK